MSEETFVHIKLPITIEEVQAMVEESVRQEAASFTWICPACDLTWPKDLYPKGKCPACPQDAGFRQRAGFHLLRVINEPVSPPPTT